MGIAARRRLRGWNKVRKKYWLPLCYSYKEGCAGGVYIDGQIYEDMMLQLRTGNEHAHRYRERAVIFGMDANGVITRLFVDMQGDSAPYYFRTAKESLERVIRFWAKRGIRFAGMVHTHRHCLQLSQGDVAFVRQLLMLNKTMNRFYFGVQAGTELAVYKFERDFLEGEKDG